jgi:hypothetical protein
MYPVLFRIGGFEITSFGVFVAIGALVGLWLFRRELRLGGLPPDASDAGLSRFPKACPPRPFLCTPHNCTSRPRYFSSWA